MHPNRLFDPAGDGPAPAGLTWDEFCDWLAFYELEPFGEERADYRQAVAIAYQNVGWLPDGTELPEITWPYFRTAEDVDIEAVRQAVEEHVAHWADWEQQWSEEQRRRHGKTHDR